MKRKFIAIIFTGALFFASCKKITEDLNTDPNRPVDAPLELLLNGAQVSSILVYEGNLARVAGIFSGSFTGGDRQYLTFNQYISTAPDYDDTWDNLYTGVISQAKLIEAKATVLNNKRVIGIAKVMQAQAFGLAADLWGDVPFSEVATEGITNPKFDTQADVYTGVQKLLDDAITNLNPTGTAVGVSPGSKDVFYGGDNKKWAAAAYTLKARFYLHTKQYDLAIAAANNVNALNDASKDMIAPHGNSYLSDFNVFYSFTVYDRPGYLVADGSYASKLLDPTSSSYIGNVKTKEGARFNYIYQSDINVGGLELNALSNDFDGSGPDDTGFFGSDAGFPLVTYRENQLILAEAYMKKASPDANLALAALNTVRNYYNTTGYVTAGYFSFGKSYLPYLLTDFAPGGIKNPALTGTTVNQALLKGIVQERYVSLIGQIEQFNDLRRTKNLLGMPPLTGTALPQRFLYPQSELNTNSNTPKLVTGDLFKPLTSNASAY
ncbi:MAG: SusD/RagB family nutrient-binding outer membrane lipoprotein [Candidatus Dojkabacteria bacterium]